MTEEPFSEEQKLYLQGFVAGCEALANRAAEPSFAGALAAIGAPAHVEANGNDASIIHRIAQDAQTQAGGKLCPEEEAKREKDPFQMWDEIRANAAAKVFPRETDVLLYKYHGLFLRRASPELFHVSPSISWRADERASVQRDRENRRRVRRRLRGRHYPREPSAS